MIKKPSNYAIFIFLAFLFHLSRSINDLSFINLYLQTGMSLDFAHLLDNNRIMRHYRLLQFIEESEFGYCFLIDLPSGCKPRLKLTAYIKIQNKVKNTFKSFAKKPKSQKSIDGKSHENLQVIIYEQFQVNVNFEKTLVEISVTVTEEIIQNCWKSFASLDKSAFAVVSKDLSMDDFQLLKKKQLQSSLLHLFEFMFSSGSEPIRILKPWDMSNLVVVKKSGIHAEEDYGMESYVEYEIEDNDQTVYCIKFMNVGVERSLLTNTGEKYDSSILQKLQEQRFYFQTVMKWIFNANSDLFGEEDHRFFRRIEEKKWDDFYVERLNIPLIKEKTGTVSREDQV